MPSTGLQPLSDFPNELWLEIISYYAYTFDFNYPMVRQEGLHERRNLRQTLRSFSQVSSTLRVLTLRFLWERLDICKSIVQPPGELECLSHVKSVHVWWSTHSPTEMETLALIDFLNSLPNLIGLQIVAVDTTQGFARVFDSASLPNVTALSIPDILHVIFAVPERHDACVPFDVLYYYDQRFTPCHLSPQRFTGIKVR
ncbi:hypothetical protein B0H16DRAFT_1732050 [Mycena metata]|uniref:Uncharacterized protein n=1 Tax=Mycena metata TaxID=1033252 RepID=A0AAD7I2X4_9AGAR|nr:hypothetical protein B0H16DRAFT_1732050 [Mycena metata]